MKRNVDLTENGLFSNNNREVSLNNLLRILDIDNKHPWKFSDAEIIESDSDLIYKKPLIVCGSSSDRKKISKRYDFESGRYCDRCGADLTKKPWDKYYGLCSRCRDELDIECSKYWKYKFDPIRESNSFIVSMLNYRK